MSINIIGAVTCDRCGFTADHEVIIGNFRDQVTLSLSVLDLLGLGLPDAAMAVVPLPGGFEFILEHVYCIDCSTGAREFLRLPELFEGEPLSTPRTRDSEHKWPAWTGGEVDTTDLGNGVRTDVTDHEVAVEEESPRALDARFRLVIEPLDKREKQLAQSIYDKTGYPPEINIARFEDLIKRASVTYFYRNLEGVWHERSVEVSMGRGAEMLINALRGAVRGANLDHQSGEAVRSSGR